MDDILIGYVLGLLTLPSIIGGVWLLNFFMKPKKASINSKGKKKELDSENSSKS